jgi:hypothetical protein
VLLDMARHLSLNVVELAGDRLEQGFDAGSGHWARQPEPLALGQLHGHQLAATRHPGGQVSAIKMIDVRRTGLDQNS